MNEHDSEREDNKKPLGVLSGVGSNPTPRTNNIKFAGSSSPEGFS